MTTLSASARRNQLRGLQNVTKLRRKLRRIYEETPNTIRPILEKAAQKIEDDIKEMIHRRTGTLEHQLAFKISADGLSAKIGLVTQSKAKKAFYFAFLDAGTKGHQVAVKNRKVLTDGTVFFGREVSVPAMPAQHIRARAFDANKGPLLNEIRAEIDATLARIGDE